MVLVAEELGLVKLDGGDERVLARCRMLLASGGGVSRTRCSRRGARSPRSCLVFHPALIRQGATVGFAPVPGVDETETADKLISSDSVHMRFISNGGRQRNSDIWDSSQNNICCLRHVVERRVV